MPRVSQDIAKRLIKRRHPEYREFAEEVSWLLDSLEGGKRYRDTVYGSTDKGIPIYNLARHKREMPLPGDPPISSYAMGQNPAYNALTDPFEMRRSRTPVPKIVDRAIRRHFGRIYSREVDRTSCPDLIKEWLSDVDGAGTSFDEWMAKDFGPMFAMAGYLDVLADRPSLPDGVEDSDVINQTAEQAYGIDRAILKIIQPANMLWWKLDYRKRYVECMIREYHEDDDCNQIVLYRHWSRIDSVLYDVDGKPYGPNPEHPHTYGIVPIIRLFDRRLPRLQNTGLSNYRFLAEVQREVYNRKSELVVSDTTQAFPQLQCPEEFIELQTVPVGPNWVLPMRKHGETGQYQGFEYVDPPKGAADSIRRNVEDMIQEADRDAALVAPAGSESTTVSQSGLSKAFDHVEASDLLSDLAQSLQKAENFIVRLAYTVMMGGTIGKEQLDQIAIIYPGEFDLFSPEDFATGAMNFETTLPMAGELPKVEAAFFSQWVRMMLPGKGDADYEEYDKEIVEFMERRARVKQQNAESAALPPSSGTSGPRKRVGPAPTDRNGDPNQGGKAPSSPAQERA
jgi:hypothetical protein